MGFLVLTAICTLAALLLRPRQAEDILIRFDSKADGVTHVSLFGDGRAIYGESELTVPVHGSAEVKLGRHVHADRGILRIGVEGKAKKQWSTLEVDLSLPSLGFVIRLDGSVEPALGRRR